MNFLSNIIGGALGSTVEKIGGTIRKFVTTEKDKMDMELEVKKILDAQFSELEKTARAELSAKENIIVAEMNQKDNYTKRARPTVVYVGLGAIIFNYCIIPFVLTVAKFFEKDVTVLPFTLPPEFWAAWGGIVATWSIGRTVEKRGIKNKLTDAITGSKSLFDK